MRILLFLLLASVLALFVTKGPQIISSIIPPDCANSETCIKDLSGTIQDDSMGMFLGDRVQVPTLVNPEISQVLGEKTGDNKRIYVDLTNQTLSAYEADKLIMTFPVSTGKWGWTPTGDFRIWIKLRYTRMAGGDSRIGTYYNLPNVPHTMYFYNAEIPKTRGYGLHGAYWHNNFGHVMSHGCINIGLENAEKLYNWANPTSVANSTYATADNPGTLITIHGTAPFE